MASIARVDPLPWLCNLLFVVLLLAMQVTAQSVHTVFPTECGRYFIWQTMGMIYSHKKAGQPGPLTRIVSCSPGEWEKMSSEEKTLVQTHVAPSYTNHPRTGDVYPAYNKPVAVIDWLAKTDVLEDFVLIIDADMIMRKPIIPKDVGARKGWAVSAFFGYMKGVNNALAMKHIPQVPPRQDSFAGPSGRRSDQIGGFTLMQTEDLRKVAPLWLKYTEDVRFDPDAWELSGDAYSKKPGDKPWISEMYGYSFACATADVWHTCPKGMMLYPGYEVTEEPYVLHYGLLWNVADSDYQFDKHWHYGFDPFKCPPWNLRSTNAKAVKGGLFPHPPKPSSFTTTGFKLLRDLLSVEVPITLNAALCEHHRLWCVLSRELEDECKVVDDYVSELDEKMQTLLQDLPDPCVDLHSSCMSWAISGECEKNAGYMFNTCRKACKACTPKVKEVEDDGEEKDVILTEATQTIADNKAGDGVEDAIDNSKQTQGVTDEQSMESIDALIVPELKLRCTQFPTWSAAQVKKCMAFAEDGIEYDPSIFDSDDDEEFNNVYNSQAKVVSIDSLFGDSLHEPKAIWSFKGIILMMMAILALLFLSNRIKKRGKLYGLLLRFMPKVHTPRYES